ncbi:MAG: Uma2 family endonuclease [Planctomycetota bacterium]|nr:MAG: Uma2 family endonuclease [Planctomycetota bacterium]REK24447.1 MAG: Uma2 family endonuclease [Planctomycetota bacterium]REK38636.1 MAG: Uma2 family endonuclease [Planctomycetota bacterium]
MATALITPPEEASLSSVETVADLVRRLGDIPLYRIRTQPPIGTATENDVVRHKCCELIDGVIVEKGMGWEESILEIEIAALIRNYLQQSCIAVVAGADGYARMRPGRVRVPDVGVYLLNRFPTNKAPRVAICDVAPDWAIEVLSRSNTKKEMELKRADLFEAGTRLIWIADPRKRKVEAWTAVDEMDLLTPQDTANLDEILPGFTVSIGDWFGQLDRVMESGDS